MPQYSMEDFFEIIRKRYENGSMIITTNRNFEDWGTLFGDKVIASAIIDRIVHHATIVKLNGSYRIKNLELCLKTSLGKLKKMTTIWICKVH
jgi:DNA replication protein DnaC